MRVQIAIDDASPTRMCYYGMQHTARPDETLAFQTGTPVRRRRSWSSGVPHDAGRRQPAAPRPGRELAATGDVPSAARVRASPARRRRRRYAAGQRMHARSWNMSESRVDSRRVAAALGNDAAGRTAVAGGQTPRTPPEQADKINEREGARSLKEAQRACACTRSSAHNNCMQRLSGP